MKYYKNIFHKRINCNNNNNKIKKQKKIPSLFKLIKNKNINNNNIKKFQNKKIIFIKNKPQ